MVEQRVCDGRVVEELSLGRERSSRLEKSHSAFRFELKSNHEKKVERSGPFDLKVALTRIERVFVVLLQRGGEAAIKEAPACPR